MSERGLEGAQRAAYGAVSRQLCIVTGGGVGQRGAGVGGKRSRPVRGIEGDHGVRGLTARHGTVLRGTTQIIKSMVPLSEMFGYATELRSRTQGRGSFTMHFSRYEEVPRNVSEEIVARVQGKVTK